MSKKNMLLIMIFAILILLVYSVDLFKLNYRLAGWEEFGDAPVNNSHIQYFVTDTPNIMSCLDRSIREDVACYEAAAFVTTDAEEIYRCCDTGEKISCLKGDFSSDIPFFDEQCIAELRSLFGGPDTLAGSRGYQFYGECFGGRFAELTVVQLDNNGKIRWKHIKVDVNQVTTSVLRCVVGPILSRRPGQRR